MEREMPGPYEHRILFERLEWATERRNARIIAIIDRALKMSDEQLEGLQLYMAGVPRSDYEKSFELEV